MRNILIILLGVACSAMMQRQPAEGIPVPDGSVNFMVIGDWGRHGQYGQQTTADVMGKVAEHFDAAAIVSTGDNIYPDGVASVSDPAWMTAFENIYTAHSLYVPWVVAIGNHGYHGSVQAQIDYTAISQRWNMPNRYYTYELFEEEDGDTVTVLFVVIDSNPFQSKYQSDTKGEYSDVKEQDTTAQKQWLEKVLSERTATWTIVVGHHPMYAGGKRKGQTDDMIKSFNEIFARHKVDAYFAGHEHDLQHHDDGSGVQYFVSGAGSEVRKTGEMQHTKFARSVNGFAAVTATRSKLTCRFVDVQGDVIYTYSKDR